MHIQFQRFNDDGWDEFTNTHNMLILEALNSHKDIVELTIGGDLYVVSLQKMKITNLSSNTSERIRLKPFDCYELNKEAQKNVEYSYRRSSGSVRLSTSSASTLSYVPQPRPSRSPIRELYGAFQKTWNVLS